MENNEMERLRKRVEMLEAHVRLQNTPDLRAIQETVAAGGVYYVTGHTLRSWDTTLADLCEKLGEGYTYEQKQNTEGYFDAFYIKKVS